MKKFVVFLSLITVLLMCFSVPGQTVNAQTYVYVTRTGKRYYYNRNDWGLKRARQVYHVTLSQAQSRGLTLAKDESIHRTVVTKVAAKKARKIHKKQLVTVVRLRLPRIKL
ncbi:hypothetical protein AKUG0417_02380 [Apilactobacillus kunkeei]|nr:hypothetical protein AKUG0417_02380 [Apilactobacillus kunkeei]